MDIRKKADLLVQFSVKYRNNPDLSSFFDEHDISIPLAYALDLGMVAELTGIGEVMIEEAYEYMVTEIFSNDPSVEYKTIDEMMVVIDLEDLEP